jgi:hypothetical protein
LCMAWCAMMTTTISRWIQKVNLASLVTRNELGRLRCKHMEYPVT